MALGATLPLSTSATPTVSARKFNDSRYNRVLLALRTYKKKNGNLLVPQPFAIPDDDESWPEKTRGLRLGARVNAIRSQGTFVKTNPERREELTALGFVWELENGGEGGRKRGRKKKVETREVLLGKAPPGMLSSDSDGEGRSEENSRLEGDVSLWDMLNEEGYGKETGGDNNGGGSVWGGGDWDSSTGGGGGEGSGSREGEEDGYTEEPDFMETIVRQQKKAIEIGIVKEIAENGAVIKGKVQMRHPWFNDDFGSDFTFDDVIEAYTVYKSIYTNFSYFDNDTHKKHVDFIVPSPDEDSSAAATALFGSNDATIDVDASARAAAAIASAGDDESADLISAEISRMEQALAAPPAVASEPAVTTLPSKTTTKTSTPPSWPAHLAGMNLSALTTRIRDGDLEVYHDPTRKAQLDKLDFPWGKNHADRILTIPFDKTMCALYAYFAIRGDLFVPPEFLMPGEEPWPEVLTDFPLGTAVEYIRRRQNFLQEYHPRKLYLLNMLEFVWFPLDADPLDPDSVEKGWEREHARRVGHPLARINEVPISVIEALGDPAEGNDDDDDEGSVGTIDKYADFDYELVRDYYENELGVRDIGKYLRDRGYFQLADEHEEMYGKYEEENEAEEGEGEEGVDFEYVYEEEEEEWEDEEYNDELDDDDLEDDDDDDEEEEEEVDYDVGAEDEDEEEEDDDEDLDDIEDDDFDIEEEEL